MNPEEEEDPQSWLPDLVLLSDYGGNWEQYLDAVYQEFVFDFVASKPMVGGKRFALKRHPLLKDKEATFWHVTSEGADEVDRTPDLRRCERIRWPRCLVDAMGTDKVCQWRQERRNKQGVMEKRIVIALRDFSYLVVLADRDDYVLLWTAFAIEYESKRRKYRKEYEDYCLLLKNG